MTTYYRGRPFIVYADKDALDGKGGFGYLLDTSFDKVFDFIIDKAADKVNYTIPHGGKTRRSDR